jgi:excisionase family DNA binding protein
MPIDFTLDIAHALASPEVVSAIESMVRQAVRAEIGDALASGQLLDVPAAAARLGLSEAALRKAVERGTVPCVRIGRRVRFSMRELHAWLKAHAVPAMDPTRQKHLSSLPTHTA